ncbi:MAG: SIR2 family NAD-dependent protein deacylase [Candidatus Thorarchaeota archaeon]
MDIDIVRKLISQSKRICALTGAGISVASGIPDFRSEGGLWARYDPLEYATFDSFLRDPTKFWTMGRELAEVLVNAEPNAAHFALAKMERDGKLIGVITQNIDNLHQIAGNSNVVELHGNYLRATCMACAREYIGDDIHKRVASGEVPPKCDDCGGILKSAAVLFGEPLPEKAMDAAIGLCRHADLMLVVGTSLTIYPAAYLPKLAKDSGAKVILVNLEGVNRDGVADCVLPGPAAEILPKIV